MTWDVVETACYLVWRSTDNNSGSAGLIGITASTAYNDASATVGTIYYYWVEAVNNHGISAFSSSTVGWRGSISTGVCADIDGDGKADLSSVVGLDWYVWLSPDYQVCYGPYSFGIAGNIPLTGYIDNDRLSDLISVVDSNWFIRLSTDQYRTLFGPYDMGIAGSTPATGFIDNDNLSDLISVVGADWYVRLSTDQYRVLFGPYDMGIAESIPVTGFIDNDMLSDLISVVGADWYVRLSTDQYRVLFGPYPISDEPPVTYR